MLNTSGSTNTDKLLPSIAVALCGAMWGVFWIPLHWLSNQGIGSGWVSLSFNFIAMLSAMPWLLTRQRWQGGSSQLLTGFLLGSAFSLYTVSLVLTDVVHAILLFYLTPVWSTLAGWLFLGEKLTRARIVAIALGFIGMAFLLGVTQGLPLPRNMGDWVALLSGLCWSAGTLRSYAKPSSSIAQPVFFFSAGGFVASSLILLIAFSLAMPLAVPGHLLDQLPKVILFAMVFFVPPNFLILWAAQRIEPGRIGILLMAEVLVGSISAALYSGAPFGMVEFVGTALIVLAGLTEVLGRR